MVLKFSDSGVVSLFGYFLWALSIVYVLNFKIQRTVIFWKLAISPSSGKTDYGKMRCILLKTL
jgi:hypothetical protein